MDRHHTNTVRNTESAMQNVVRERNGISESGEEQHGRQRNAVFVAQRFWQCVQMPRHVLLSAIGWKQIVEDGSLNNVREATALIVGPALLGVLRGAKIVQSRFLVYSAVVYLAKRMLLGKAEEHSRKGMFICLSIHWSLKVAVTVPNISSFGNESMVNRCRRGGLSIISTVSRMTTDLKTLLACREKNIVFGHS